MIGSPEDPQSYGIIPCAISWLFKGIQEQKARTGARFSVRVSAVEVSGPASPVKDLLAGQSNGNYIYICILFSVTSFTKYRDHLDFRKAAFLSATITSHTKTLKTTLPYTCAHHIYTYTY